jgi:hypothetical protein
MTPIHKTAAFAGILLYTLTLPQVSYGITGCTNGNVMGVYNAQISSSGLMNVLNTINSGVTAPTTGTVGAAANPGGFGNNPNSLTGKIPGLGRYLLDGNGNINGTPPGTTGFVTIGTYTVNDDCSATMSLNTGETFNAIVAANGSRVLFIESDATGGGAIGELDLATTACIAGAGGPQTFAFNIFGAQQVSPPSTGTSPTASLGSIFGSNLASSLAAAGTVPTSVTLQPTAALGSITLDGQGNFSLSEWMYASGSLKPVKASGTYSFGMNCNLTLSFNPATGATTGSSGSTPASVQGIIVSSSTGLLTFQTDQVATDIVTGQLVGQ